MKNFILTFFALLIGSTSFAIDQVILNSGEVLEGKVLSEVPNRYVDIAFPNGTKRRVTADDVKTVERDVPSNIDRTFRGSDSEAYFGIALGGLLGINGLQKDLFFNTGAKFGFNVSQLGDFAKFAPGIKLNYTPVTGSGLLEILVFPGFRKIYNSGLYVNPELGIIFFTGGASAQRFALGATAGYEYFAGENFSIGPDLGFANWFDGTGGGCFVRFTLSGTFHF